MTTTIKNGRLGNQIIRNLAVSLIAEKYDLHVNYCNKHLFDMLGIELFCGSKIHPETNTLSDDNYFSIYHCDNVDFNLNPNPNYFQTKDITNFLYTHLHTEKSKNNIIEKNPFNKRYNSNNDVFVHIRLDDVSRLNPGIDYYVNTINKIEFDDLYISTDQQTHPIITKLLQLYPNAKVIQYDEVNTIQFSSTCKNIILSHGSFSAVIGYLSFFSNIYYPAYEETKIWYGDMCSINNWVKCSDHLPSVL